MKFTEVKEVPVPTNYKNVRQFIDDFIKADIAFAKVHYTEKDYVSAHSCAGSLKRSAKRMNVQVTAIVRGQEVYLVNQMKLDSSPTLTIKQHAELSMAQFDFEEAVEKHGANSSEALNAYSNILSTTLKLAHK